MALDAENPLVICSTGKGAMHPDKCLKCALDQENDCGYDYALLRVLFTDPPRTGIHVTDLTGCLRRSYLDKAEPSPEYVHEMLIRSLGTMTHGHFEGSDEYLDSEIPVEADGIVGRADIVYKDGRIVDFKTTRWLMPDKLPYSSHGLQVNIYAYLLRKMGREINSLQIQYIDLSGPAKCRIHKMPVRYNALGQLTCPVCDNSPKGAHLGAVLFDIPFLPEDEIARTVNERRDALNKALKSKEQPKAEPSFLCNYCAHVEKCAEGLAQAN